MAGRKKTIRAVFGVVYTGLTDFRRQLANYIERVTKDELVLLLKGDKVVAVVISADLAEKHGLMPKFGDKAK